MKPALKLNFPFQRSVACQRCVRRRYYANLLHDTGLEGSSYFLPVPSPKPFASWTQLSYLSLKKKNQPKRCEHSRVADLFSVSFGVAVWNSTSQGPSGHSTTSNRGTDLWPDYIQQILFDYYSILKLDFAFSIEMLLVGFC